MAEDLLFRRIAGAVVVALLAVSIYYRHRADKAGGRVTRDDEPTPIRLGLGISALMGFGGLILYFIWPPALGFTLLPLPTQLRWAGVAVSAICVSGTWWIFRTLGLNITRTSKTRENATLVTTGPYRFVRHPFYVNVAIAFASLSVVTRSWWFVVWIVPALALLAIRTRKEEANLEARFGDAWRAYAARTGRFVPRLAR
jgi:protein-S-isoprenylcysteine O-methyltransferase Ste14